jgi:urease accessory protein
VTTWSHVAARASRAQGRTFLDVAQKTFALPTLDAARQRLLRGNIEGHFAPVFGFVGRAVELSRDDTLRSFLHLGLRGVLSAAVRLGLLGPFAGQRLHHALRDQLSRAVDWAADHDVSDIAQTAPVIELFQTTQDRLYARLFQS